MRDSKNTSGLLATDTAFYKSADLPGIPCSNLPRVTLEQQQTNKTKKGEEAGEEHTIYGN